jgi:roadblock/LC7 domain-containing protein
VERTSEGKVMTNKYLNLQTGTLLNAAELLDIAGAKDRVWTAADELYSLLSEMVEERVNESQRLLMDAAVIQGHLKTYDQAQQELDNTEHKEQTGEEQNGEHLATLDELAAVKGVNVAAQWTDNHILRAYKSQRGISDEEARQKAQFCITVSMMLNNFVSSFTPLSGVQWTPQQGWAYSGGEWTVAVGKGGKLGVYLDTAEADFNRLIEVLFE